MSRSSQLIRYTYHFGSPVTIDATHFTPYLFAISECDTKIIWRLDLV